MPSALFLYMHHSNSNVVTWIGLIDGYAKGTPKMLYIVLNKCSVEGILPNAVTYACTLKACAQIGDADRGNQIHGKIARQDLLQRDTVLGNALVDMYAKCRYVSLHA